MIVRLVLLLACALVATAGAILTKWQVPNLGRSNHQGTAINGTEILGHLNSLRGSSQPLAWDDEISTWLENIIPAQAQVEDVSADSLLADLQDSLPSLAAASAGVFRVPNSGPTLFRELEQWMDARESEYTHTAMVTRQSSDRPGLTNTWAVLAIRFPDFTPDKLAGKHQEFHHVCARCGKDYNGRFAGGDRILLLRCPHCSDTHDILALGTDSQYRRVNAFMQGFEPKANFPNGMSKLQELERIWRTVLGHCQYTNDTASKYATNKDFWQASDETFGKQSGDCEDTSILLADWLSRRGIEARVVIGETSALLGHAWCVARVDGITYLLETTLAAEDARSLRRAEDTEDEYRPDYQFDRDHLYFRQGKKAWISDYWSDNLWERVDYLSNELPASHDKTQWVTTDAWLPQFEGAEAEIMPEMTSLQTSTATQHRGLGSVPAQR